MEHSWPRAGTLSFISWPSRRVMAASVRLWACTTAASAIPMALGAWILTTQERTVPPVLGALLFFLLAVACLSDAVVGLSVYITAVALSPELFGRDSHVHLQDLILPLLLPAAYRAWRRGNAHDLPRAVFLPSVAVVGIGLLALIVRAMATGALPPCTAALIWAKRSECLAIPVLVYLLVRSEREVRALALLSVAAGAVGAALSLGYPRLSFFSTDGQEWLYRFRVMGPAGELHHTWAAFLLLPACVAAGLLQYYPHGGRRHAAGFGTLALSGALYLALGLMLAGVALTYSRQGYLMVAASVVALMLTGGRRPVSLAVLTGLVVVTATVPTVRARAVDIVSQLRSARPEAERHENPVSDRLMSWRIKVAELRQNPLSGSGVGTQPLSVDNEFLHRALETGAAGLAAFVWQLLALTRFLLAIHPVGLPGALRLAALAALAALLVQAAAAPAFSAIRPAEAFWTLIGLTAASARAASTARAGPTRPCPAS